VGAVAAGLRESDALCDAGSMRLGAWRRINLVLILVLAVVAIALGISWLRGGDSSHGSGLAFYRAYWILFGVQALSRHLREKAERREVQRSPEITPS
jgi:hypothetical protein